VPRAISAWPKTRAGNALPERALDPVDDLDDPVGQNGKERRLAALAESSGPMDVGGGAGETLPITERAEGKKMSAVRLSE
jgi:hypothetical protein